MSFYFISDPDPTGSESTTLPGIDKKFLLHPRHRSNSRRGAGGPEAQNSVCEAGDSRLPRPLLCPLPTSTHHKQEGQYNNFRIVLSTYLRYMSFLSLFWIHIAGLDLDQDFVVTRKIELLYFFLII
jgi:hypothetical protein